MNQNVSLKIFSFIIHLTSTNLIMSCFPGPCVCLPAHCDILLKFLLQITQCCVNFIHFLKKCFKCLIFCASYIGKSWAWNRKDISRISVLPELDWTTMAMPVGYVIQKDTDPFFFFPHFCT